MKKHWAAVLAAGAGAVGAVCAAVLHAKKYNWGALDKRDRLNEFDTALPDLSGAYANREQALQNGGGWYVTMSEDFEGDALPELWHYSPHGKRATEFWCDETVSFANSCCTIQAYRDEAHACAFCRDALHAQEEAYQKTFRNEYTGGIETRYFDENGDSVQTFAQAFGYFECRARLPQAEGMWAAFWLQSVCQGKIGNGGEDGTEIDVFESAFKNVSGNKMGHALLYDGYEKHGRVLGYINTNDGDLYDGFHTYAVKWSPQAYVFYVDGVARWATDFGGVSKVPEFLRLTCEIRHGYGPHGMKLRLFNAEKSAPAQFDVDYVRVYQNTAYEPFIRADSDYSDMRMK